MKKNEEIEETREIRGRRRQKKRRRDLVLKQ